MTIDKDRISGAGNQMAGSVKETAGKLVGDDKLATDGKTQKVEGKIQSAVGKAKDDVRDVIKP